MPRLSWTAAALILACAEQRELAFPDPRGARAALLAVEAEGLPMFLHAIDLEQSGVPTFTTFEGSAIHVLYYDVPFAELLLPPGPLEGPKANEESQPIPSPDRLFESFLDGELDPWTEVDAIPEVLASARVAGGPRTCAERGGCYADEEARRRRLCRLPCEPGADPTPPNPPEPPAPPVEVPEPPPRMSCSSGTVQLVDESTCRTLGSPCPAGDFADVMGPARYVLPTAAPGGTGTSTAPYQTIGEALAGAPSGLVLALGKGTHAAFDATDLDVILLGACVEETIIFATDQAAIRVRGGRLTLSDLSVQSASTSLDLSFATVHLEGVRLGGRAVVRSGMLTAEGVLLTDTPTTALYLEEANAELRHAVFSDVRHGARVGPSSALILEDSIVTNTSSRALMFEGSDVTIRRSVIERTSGYAIRGANGTLSIEDSIIRDTADSADGDGIAISIRATGLSMSKARIERHAAAAIAAESSNLALADVVVREIGGGDTFVFGINLFGGTTAAIDRVGIFDSAGWALAITRRSSGVVRDVTIQNVGPSRSDGKGIVIGDRVSPLTIERASIEDVFYDGIAVGGPSSDVTLRDVSIANVGLGPDPIGKGLYFIQSPHSGVVERLSISDAREVAVIVQDSARVSITDLSIARAPAPALFVGAATTTVSRMHAEETGGGIAALFESIVTASDVALERMRAGPARFAGHGFETGGVFTVTRFSISGCTGAGIFEATDDQTSASVGRVEGCIFGASVPEGFPLEALLLRTDLSSNGAVFDVRPQ